jgi:hypothetical protein
MPEATFQEQVAQMADRLIAPPAVWCAYPAGMIELSAAQAAKLIRAGLRRGWPDFLLIHAGRIYGMELKKIGGKLSKTRTVRFPSGAPRILEGQEDVFPRLERAGMQPIAICRTIDEVERQWRAWRIPLRGRIAA